MRRVRVKELRKKAHVWYMALYNQLKQGRIRGKSLSSLASFPCYFRRVKELYNQGGLA